MQQHQQTQQVQARVGTLMFPSSCLDGGITCVGPGRYPQHTRAWYAREAVGSSQNKPTAAINEPNTLHGTNTIRMVAERRLQQFHIHQGPRTRSRVPLQLGVIPERGGRARWANSFFCTGRVAPAEKSVALGGDERSQRANG